MTQLDSGRAPGIGRRDLLKRGALVGAAAAWTVPIVQVVSMTPAHADSPSAPPVQPPPVQTTAVPPPDNHPPIVATIPPRQPHDSKAPHVAAAAARPAGTSSSAAGDALANTGTTTPVGPTVGIGAAAIAIGAGALTAAHVVKNRQERSADAE